MDTDMDKKEFTKDEIYEAMMDANDIGYTDAIDKLFNGDYAE